MPGDIILLYIHVYHKWRSYDIWFLKYKVQQTEIFDILGHFLLFQLLDNLENQNFKIQKNIFLHILHICTTNNKHIMYGSEIWSATDITVILDRFFPFTHLWTQKIKIFKKMKQHLKTLSFCKHKWQSYDLWFLRYGVQQT